jgi:hypothetical protein
MLLARGRLPERRGPRRRERQSRGRKVRSRGLRKLDVQWEVGALGDDPVDMVDYSKRLKTATVIAFAVGWLRGWFK